MIYNTITVNNTEIICFSDGSVEWFNGRFCEVRRTFGHKNSDGYPKVCLGNKNVSVHRIMARAFIEGWDESLCVDHIDGDHANNRIENLRMATHSQNNRAFSKPRKGVTSKYRGVSRRSDCNRWVAQATLGSKRMYIGIYVSELEAALAFDSFAVANGFLPEALNFNNHN